ncbi:MAG: metalloregulator ArsR/SmtB family transcription factor [Candidatus Bilamarchaeaceae archaeon]
MKFFPYYYFFKNFANSLRLRIILSLKAKPQSVSDLVLALDEEQSKISHHLSILRRCKIVKSERKGKRVIYYLDERILPFLLAATRCVEKCRGECKYAKSCLYG